MSRRLLARRTNSPLSCFRVSSGSGCCGPWSAAAVS